MVPSSYHSFFSGAVSAAAALIGLLFVAISVAPHELAGEQAEASFRVKAGMAFSVLINALVISLFALLPGEKLPTVGVVAAIAGLSSTLGLALLAARNAELHARRLLIGIDRAWELLGAVRTGLIKLTLRALHERHAQEPSLQGPASAESTAVRPPDPADREQQ